MMEFKCTQADGADGVAGGGDVAVEIVCNPNAYASAFAAKAMVTLRARGVKLTAEGALSALRQARACACASLTRHSLRCEACAERASAARGAQDLEAFKTAHA
jgi:hypothetical protein